MAHLTTIRAFLARVRGRLLAARVFEAALASAAGLALLVLLAALAAAWGDAPQITRWAFGIGAGAYLVLTLWRILGRARRETSSDAATARWVESRLDGFHNALVSSVQLSADLDRTVEFGASRSLVGGLIESTAKRIAALDPTKLVDWQPVKLYARAGAAVLGLGALVYFVAGASLNQGIDILWHGPPEPVAVDGPDIVYVDSAVRDIELQLEFPAYSGLPTRQIKGSSGDIVALAGTRVTFRATSAQPAVSAALVVGEDDTRVPLSVSEGGRLEGTLLVEFPTTYRVQLQTPEAQKIQERSRRSVDVQPDDEPDVAVLLPDDDVEMRLDEIALLAFRARDDFGLESVDLVYRKVGDVEETRKRLATLNGEDIEQGQTELPLADAELEPGDLLEVWFEAKDQDTIAGPKVGRSDVRAIKVWSPKEKHEELVDRLAAVAEAMLDVLADRLESPADTKDPKQITAIMNATGTANAKAKIIVEELGSIVEEARTDPLMPEGVPDQIAEIYDRQNSIVELEAHTLERLGILAVTNQRRPENIGLIASHYDEAVSALEDDIMELEDIVEKLRNDLLKEDARDLLAEQNELTELLEELMESGDPNMASKALDQISELERQLQEMMADLAKQAKEMPHENMNTSSLDPDEMAKGMDDFQKELDEIREMLAKGDIEGALEKAKEMQRKMAEMMAMMDQEMDGFGGTPMDPEQQQAMEELAQEVAELAKEQQDLLEKTEALDDELQEQLRQMIEEQLQEFLNKQKDRADEMRQKIAEAGKEPLSDEERRQLKALDEQAKFLEELLEERALREVKRQAEKASGQCENAGNSMGENAKNSGDAERQAQLERASGSVKQAGQLAKEIAEDIENAIPKPEDMMSQGQKNRMKQLADRQGKNRERLEQMTEGMGKPNSNLPPMPGKVGEALGEAGESMGQAGKKLGQNKPGQAEGPERSALDRLGQAQQKMQQMMQRPGDGAGHSRQRSKDRVEVPEADDHKAPKEFRDEIMRAMKEAAPKEYQPLNERYYEELVK